MDYIFRAATENDLDTVFSLYEKRVNWMNENGIMQWNVTDYLTVYPKQYYQEQLSNGTLYVLSYKYSIVGAVVLLQSDIRWSDKSDSSAVYIHNLVTDTSVKGVGKIILLEAEKIAAQAGKQYIRLDCSVDNSFLNSYYLSLGYEPAGQCRDSGYIGNRFEKNFINSSI